MQVQCVFFQKEVEQTQESLVRVLRQTKYVDKDSTSQVFFAWLHKMTFNIDWESLFVIF